MSKLTAKIVTAWEEVDSNGSNYIEDRVKDEGSTATMYIDYEEFNPSDFDLDLSSLKSYNQTLKELMSVFKKALEKEGLQVELSYTHSPYSKTSYTDVQVDLKVYDKKLDKLGKFKDFIDL